MKRLMILLIVFVSAYTPYLANAEAMVTDNAPISYPEKLTPKQKAEIKAGMDHAKQTQSNKTLPDFSPTVFNAIENAAIQSAYRKASEGDADSLYYVGYAKLILGESVFPHSKDGLFWVKQAALRDHYDASKYVAAFYFQQCKEYGDCFNARYWATKFRG